MTFPQARRLGAGAVVIATTLCALAAWPVRADTPPPVANQLALSATASVEVTRDVLGITFSTQREGPDAAMVQSQLTQALDAALAEARKVARPGQVDVSTGNFSIFPRYAPKAGPTQWQGTVELRVEGRDIDTLTRLVGRIQTLSVARVGYSLSREAREKVQGDVSSEAITRFRSQAEAYAKAFGFNSVSLRAVEVSSNESSNAPMPMFRVAAKLRADGRGRVAGGSRQGHGQRHCHRQCADEVAHVGFFEPGALLAWSPCHGRVPTCPSRACTKSNASTAAACTAWPTGNGVMRPTRSCWSVCMD